jgi:feruloyl esterase
MRTSERRRHRPKLSVSIVALGALGGSALIAAPAAAALPGCTVTALSALGVPNVTVTAAVDVPAANPIPEFCDVSGTVTTSGHGAPDGLAHFEVQLPANWNHKLYVKGMGGFAGFSGLPGVPIGAFASDNAVDDAQVLVKGYATAISDTGHTGHGFNTADLTGIVTDARWALTSDGTPDEAKLTDYFFRATHDVTVAAKQLAEEFFGQGKVRRAYFDGCSNGGRMAFQEASRFPDDFDGIIAGDPFMSIRSIAAGPNFDKQQLTPATFIPFITLPLIDQAVLASCDAADGVKDGLIQNPAACSFKAQSLLCPKGQTTNCLSQGQVDTLNAYLSGARDDDGHVVYPGFTVSDLGGTDGEAAWTNGFFLPGLALPPGDTQATFDLAAKEPWGDDGFTPAPLGWQFVDHAIRYIVERDPNFNTRTFGGPGTGPLSDATLALFDRRTEAGDADDPAAFDRFIDQNRKLLIYHGLSDPALTAIRSIMFYEDLAQRADGGFAELQENVRMFLVPGMHHCSGGPGPNTFDTLTALENWVEQGIGPDAIVATKFVNDNPASGASRTMPLCKFPEKAHFLGNPKTATAAEIDNAENWACSPHDTSMLQVGLNGRQAGLGTPQAAEGNDDRDDDRDHRHAGD